MDQFTWLKEAAAIVLAVSTLASAVGYVLWLLLKDRVHKVVSGHARACALIERVQHAEASITAWREMDRAERVELARETQASIAHISEKLDTLRADVAWIRGKIGNGMAKS